MKLFLPLFTLLFCLSACEIKTKNDHTTYYENHNKEASAPYDIGIAYWKALAADFDQLKLLSYKETDAGFPLHLAVWSYDGKFKPNQIKKAKRPVFLVNNAIHPGEPDGVDASMMLIRDILKSPELQQTYKDIVICIIPYYNIGGALYRNSHTRTNQNGPEAYGFRGNGRNYDLNRDFMKMDSKNMWAFAEIFHDWEPHIFLDNHVSNGADYQHVMTYLATQEDKLGSELAKYMRVTLNPVLEKKMKEKGFPMSPYVNVWGTSPDASGIDQFYDSPRYSSGYAALFNTIAYVAETHMLKPYKERTEATYALMETLLVKLAEDAKGIVAMKERQVQIYASATTLPLNWEHDKSYADSIEFLGYDAEYKQSDIGTHQRLYYDRSKPFQKTIAFRNSYNAIDIIDVPLAYVLPQSQHHIIDRFRANKIEMDVLEKDSAFEVTVYHYADFETGTNPYEGHYLHHNTTVTSSTKTIQFRKGDYVVSTIQKGARYIVQALEPTAVDSYFNWNFFDAYLQQKEHFSPYVFEDKASKILTENPELKRNFEAAKIKDKNLANNWYAQLDWIHKQSKHYEKTHLRHPIFRVEGKQKWLRNQ
ncbi:MAG: hypothetical protein ACI8ZO_001266 [Flavobacteriales bacterium]|jgi:hypothetical protein